MRFILAILFAIGIVAVIFVLIFRGGNGQEEQQAQRIDLNRYANTDATVQLDVDGRTVANQTHRAYRISINRTQASMQVFSGYENTVISAKTYPNNQMAYTNFIKSISILGFTDVDQQSQYGNDERGFCPTGQRYVYRLNEGNRELLRAWSSSCSGQGTFSGSAANIRSLFGQQIPDRDKLLVGTGL